MSDKIEDSSNQRAINSFVSLVTTPGEQIVVFHYSLMKKFIIGLVALILLGAFVGAGTNVLKFKGWRPDNLILGLIFIIVFVFTFLFFYPLRVELKKNKSTNDLTLHKTNSFFIQSTLIIKENQNPILYSKASHFGPGLRLNVMKVRVPELKYSENGFPQTVGVLPGAFYFMKSTGFRVWLKEDEITAIANFLNMRAVFE